MGKKYASIHIPGDQLEGIISKLQEFYRKRKQDMIRQNNLASSVFRDPAVQQMFQRFGSLAVEEILIVQAKSSVSIYDESLSFETVEKKAKSLSNRVDLPVLYASNFDEDVFVFGVFRSGKLKTSGKVGQGLSEYGLIPQTIDIEKFCNEVGIDNTSMEALTSTVIDDIEATIEQNLQIALDLSVDDVQCETDKYAEVPVDGGLLLYNRL